MVVLSKHQPSGKLIVSNTAIHIDARKAFNLILAGDAPEDLHVGKSLSIYDCPGFTCLYEDPRGYKLVRIASGYHSGCRRFATTAEALTHWGHPDYPDAERGAAYCTAIKREEARRENMQRRMA